MPLYVYECPNCKKSVELMQKFSEKAAPLCDDCTDPATGSHIQMETVMQSTSFVLKGGCWARDGYK